MINNNELIDQIKSYNRFLNSDSLNKAYNFALEAHQNQKRDEGVPYIIACLLLPIIGIGLYPRLITESYIASINNLVDRDLTAVKGAVKTNIFSGTKTNDILKAPTI